MSNPKPIRWQSKKYRDAARGQDCKIMLPGCRNEVDTVVLAHRPGSGTGTKNADHDACDCCAYCHDLLDRRRFDVDISRSHIEDRFERGRLATIINRIERAVLK